MEKLIEIARAADCWSLLADHCGVSLRRVSTSLVGGEVEVVVLPVALGERELGQRARDQERCGAGDQSLPSQLVRCH
jgi:hypothetical protein